MFRMDHSTFCYMVNALKPLIERDYLQSERGGLTADSPVEVSGLSAW